MTPQQASPPRLFDWVQTDEGRRACVAKMTKRERAQLMDYEGIKSPFAITLLVQVAREHELGGAA